ncbi:hypothetical protein HOD20_05205 [archaeon]|jgi:phosphate uptake regulator|nr:hypothetical protein [archaeon]MBT4648366.1 hypothetical protein [archaeon]MBT6821567.1 hypothetical protein [archaeon]MBT7391603.1 hypothetical protein [archaeon]
MESRKIQKSGTTFYVYLPALWCREQNITTNSVVFLKQNPRGDLIIEKKKQEDDQLSLSFELKDTNHEVINKFIVASYINPVKKFEIKFNEKLNPKQILEHKKILSGLELLDFEEDKVYCQTTLSLGDPDILLFTMIRKINSMASFIKKGTTFELIERYEMEIDKCNLLVNKSIISSLMHKKDSKLRHVELFYIGHISKMLEQIADTLINIKKSNPVLDDILKQMKNLEIVLENLNEKSVSSYIKSISRLENVKVKDSKTFYQKRVYSVLGHIGETLADWVITKKIDV